MNLRHIIWKELTLQLRPAGRIPRHLMARLAPVALVFFATLLLAPQILQGERIEFAVVLTGLLLMSVAAVSPVALTGDTIAGERERHTLETVLCAPITPRRLYWGKAIAHMIVLAAMLAFATLLTIILLAATPITPELRRLGFISLPFIVLTMAVLGVLVLTTGHLASIRSSSVKEANTRFGVYMMIGFSIGFLPTSVLSPIIIALAQTNGPTVALLALAALQLVAGLAFIFYLGYLILQIVNHTDPERFTIDA